MSTMKEVSPFYQEFKKEIDATFDNLINKFDEHIQDNVIKMIGKDLYDYSDVPEIKINEIQYNDIVPDIYSQSFVNGEKIVIEISEVLTQQSIHQMTLVTNYGRIYTINYNCSQRKDYYYGSRYYPKKSIINHNFWIPKDYIFIIKSITDNMMKSTQNHCGIKSISGTICNLIDHIKENLYNGKYVKNNVDIKLMDVYAEKQKLEEEKKEFEKYKKEVESAYKSQQDDIKKRYQKLKNDESILEKKKKQYSVLATKIANEQDKLKKQKEEFEKRVLDNTSIDDLLNKIDSN